MNEKFIMSPGPTYINDSVRHAMALPILNPDLDLDFFELYKETCDKMAELIGTKNEVLILNGEGILGLEAACCSLIEPADKVLCIDNGVFGNGFGDFAKMFTNDVTYYSVDWHNGIDVNKLETFLKENHDFKSATLVHCETPTGIVNPIAEICKLLKKYNILTIVDAVSSLCAYNICPEDIGIDILLGGSQKCLSCPPGLTIMIISDAARQKIYSRKSPINSFYTNLTIWNKWYDNKWFPYTQPVSEIYALNKGIQNILDEGTNNFIKRHETIAQKTRDMLSHSGLKLYAADSFSNTVTAFIVPEKINAEQFRLHLAEKYNLILGGGLGDLKDTVLRIGHMGENCYEGKIDKTFSILKNVFNDFGILI